MTTLMLNLIIFGGIASWAFFTVFVIHNPKRWLNILPISLTNNHIKISIENKSGERIHLDQLGVAWQVGKGEFQLVYFPQKIREIMPYSTLSEEMSTDSLQDQITSLIQSSKHRITLDLKINDKRKCGKRDFTYVNVKLDNSHNQHMDFTVKTPVD